MEVGTYMTLFMTDCVHRPIHRPDPLNSQSDTVISFSRAVNQIRKKKFFSRQPFRSLLSTRYEYRALVLALIVLDARLDG